MADRLVVMSEGSVRQVGTQRDLYERPADRFVAGFVGRSTFITGRVASPGLFRSDGGIEIRCNGSAPGEAALAIRPERISISPARIEGVDNSIEGSVEFVSYLGAQIDVHVRVSPSERIVVQIANRAGGFAPQVGERVHAGWSSTDARVFSGRAEGS